MKRQPSSIGITRTRKSSYLHSEVVRNLEQIAKAEDKSFSYVVAEVVYSFFGLKVSEKEVRRLSKRIRRNNILRFRRAS